MGKGSAIRCSNGVGKSKRLPSIRLSVKCVTSSAKKKVLSVAVHNLYKSPTPSMRSDLSGNPKLENPEL